MLFLATLWQAEAGDGASFVSQTVPTNTVVAPGQTFTQTWTLQNTGTTSWSPGESGYALMLSGMDSLGAVPVATNVISTLFHPYATIDSGSSIGPGATATFSLSFIAPETPGTYSDCFQMANASGVAFGPQMGVQVIVQQSGPAGQYDRARAVSYANNYGGFVCSDGYFWTNGSGYGNFGALAPVPTSPIGDDCAHFVSCCIGSEPNQKGGGLSIPGRVPPTYGEPGAGRLVGTCLIGAGLATEVFSLSSLRPGDVIAWNWEGDDNIGDIDHDTIYLGNGLLAAHSASHVDATTAYYQESEPGWEWHLIHIFDSGDTTPPVVSIASPTNGQIFTVSNITVSGTAYDPGSPSTGVILVEALVNGNGDSLEPASGTTNWMVSVSLSPGTNTVYVASQDGGGNYSAVASVNVTYQASAITLSPPALSNLALRAAYSQNVTATGGVPPYTFGITSGSLPAGLSLSSSGTLSGTPSAAGTSAFTVTATDSTGYSGSQAFVLVVISSQGYASGVTNTAGQIQYCLNAPAGTVQVVFDNGSTLASLGSQCAGLHSFGLGAHTNYSIAVSNQGSGSPVQVSVDSTLNDFYGPRGVAVNLNAKNANFGRIYVANAAVGTDSRRTTQRGVYALNADLSDAFGYGATAYPPIGTATNQIQYGSSTTYAPYHLSVGPDDMVYLADASGALGVGTTVGGGVWMLSPDLTKTVDLFPFNGTLSSPGLVCAVGTPNVSGSVASGDLVLYTVEWNRQPYNNIWQYNLGRGPFPCTTAPVQLASAGIPSVNEVLADLCIAPDGKFFACEYRLSATGGNVSLRVYAKDGLTYLWDSSTAAGGTDPFVNSWCMAVSPDDQYVATGTGGGSIDLCHLTNGIPDLSTFRTIAAGFGGTCRAVAWDMADNVYGVSGSDDLLRVFSLGLSAVAITSNDLTGTNGTFQLLTASSPPLILAQPQNQQTAAGSNATFAVNASSVSALSYQWRFDGTDLPGASTSVLTITNVLLANAGSYQLVVTNANGAVTSAVAVLAVNKADPIVTAWPAASAITCGQTLAASALSGGTATPAGCFAWTTPAVAPTAGTALQSVTYTPADITDYNCATGSVSLVVMPPATPPVLSRAGQSGEFFTFTWSATQGQRYQIQYITDLSQTNWTDLGDAMTATDSAPTASDSITNLQRFYRLVLLP
ncbi:MAG TPA: NBR1-Ig-like domain-containing protein [Candidatus Acidoferrum sp.]|nr:NBR1-Ig-like domain-containing protein [Candidatus Acidoferrum sp.]